MKKILSRSCVISTRVLAIVFLLILVAMQTVKFTMPTVRAQSCSTPVIDMKLLVITNGKSEANFPAIQQILNYVGTPYDVLDMTVDTGGITASMLSDGACHGYYQGIIFAFGGYIYTLPGMANLTAYEQAFAVRQLNWYMQPNNDFGFNFPHNETIPSSGTDSMSYTSAGSSVFFYANKNNPVPITNANIYLGTPLDATALPPGASVTPLLVDPSGYTLSLVYNFGDGREYLTQTFDSNPFLLHNLVLAYGLINWVTKGVFLGEYHIYAAAQVDDFFINSSEWVPGTPCTNPITGDRTPPDDPSLPLARINSADMTSLVNWQNGIQSDPLLANFELTLAFNGVGTTGNTDWTGLPSSGRSNDDLTTNVQNYQSHFHWIGHTYNHPETLNGLHKSDPGGDPNTPQTDYIDFEILTNIYVATGGGENLDTDPSDTVIPLNLTDFNPANLVTPGVTGLNDPLVPSYLVQNGIQYVVTDTSVTGSPNNGPNPSPNVGIVNTFAPGLYGVPRRPNNIYFNAANWDDIQAEFACLHSNQPPFNSFTASQILDFVSSGFVANMLLGDIDPQMFHQLNLRDYDGQGHSLMSDVYDQTFSKYKQLFNRGVLSLTLDQLGQSMKNRNAYNLSMATARLTGAPGSQTISITMPATATVSSAIIPVTGLYSMGAEAYGGQYISHIQMNAGQTITLPVTPTPLLPNASSLTLNPTSVTGGAQSSTGTVTLSGPAPAAGAQVTLSSSNAAASVPASVTIPAGSDSTTFTISANPAAASTVARIFASYDGVTPSASLTVRPPSVSSLMLNPTSVTGGAQSSTGTVTLSAAAPSGGAQVALSSSSSAASPPATVTIPAGASSASFTVSTQAVAASTIATISASYRGTTRTASLSVTPPPITVSSLTLNPTSVRGGAQSSTGTVTLSAAAPPGGAQVALSSSSSAASPPASVTIPAGASGASFTVSTQAVAASTAATISASYHGTTRTASLTVRPPPPPVTVSSLTLNPTSVIGGLQFSTGTVTLSGPAPAGGAQVMLSSGNGAARVPSSVTIPAGSASATFTVSTSIVLISTSATISASYNSTTQSATLAVLL